MVLLLVSLIFSLKIFVADAFVGDIIPDPLNILDRTKIELEAKLFDGFGDLPDFFNNSLTDLFSSESTSLIVPPDFLYCAVCQVAFKTVIVQRRYLHVSKDTIINTVSKICTVAQIYTERNCYGIISEQVPTILYIIDKDPLVTAEKFCCRVFQNYGCFKKECTNKNCHDVQLPPPPILNVTGPQPTFNELVNVLHLSDNHVDHMYKSFGNAKCKEMMCCQTDQPDATDEANKCGAWIDYRDSDMSWDLINATLQHIKNTHQLKGPDGKCIQIFYTGDVISHRSWQSSDALTKTILTKYFGVVKEILECPIIPIIGNHEASPCNQYPPIGESPDYSPVTLFNFVADLFTTQLGFLPNECAETIRKGGYYSYSPTPKLVILGLNNNVAFTFNWWLVYKGYECDPYDQLKYAVEVLTKAEKEGKIVQILTHVPSGDFQCSAWWSKQYNRIIARFHKIISFHLNGHTHFNHFFCQFNENPPYEVINCQFNGAALTTYINGNPSYQFYQMDKETYVPMDKSTWYMNVTLANLNGLSQTPQWTESESFCNMYGINDMTNSEMYKAFDNYVTDDELRKKHNELRCSYGDPCLQDGCDNNCKRKNLCEITTTDSGNNKMCEMYTEMLDANL